MQNTHISATIKNLCKNKSISITSLLADCNLSKSFIYDLEKRSASPSCAKITKIADYLDCSVDYLLGRTDNPEVNKTIQPERVYKLSLLDQGEIAAEGGSLTNNVVNKKEETTF